MKMLKLEYYALHLGMLAVAKVGEIDNRMNGRFSHSNLVKYALKL